LLGLGIVGTYAWRAYENTKGRPLAIVASQEINAVSAVAAQIESGESPILPTQTESTHA
jgi:hypothetical protein